MFAAKAPVEPRREALGGAIFKGLMFGSDELTDDRRAALLGDVGGDIGLLDPSGGPALLLLLVLPLSLGDFLSPDPTESVDLFLRPGRSLSKEARDRDPIDPSTESFDFGLLRRLGLPSDCLGTGLLGGSLFIRIIGLFSS